jgi:hypothetical protein
MIWLLFFTLSEQFGLEETRDQSLFLEWQENLPTVSDAERQTLERARSNFTNLNRDRPTSEEAVKMVVLSPFLDLAGFYQPPFQLKTEVSTEISAKEDGILYKGSIDALVALDRFWILIIESKSTRFDVMTALPQALVYLLSSPQDRPTFALLVNGREFLFVKLLPHLPPRYVLSKAFSLTNPGDDAAEALAVLKRIGELLKSYVKTPTQGNMS